MMIELETSLKERPIDDAVNFPFMNNISPTGTNFPGSNSETFNLNMNNIYLISHFDCPNFK